MKVRTMDGVMIGKNPLIAPIRNAKGRYYQIEVNYL